MEDGGEGIREEEWGAKQMLLCRNAMRREISGPTDETEFGALAVLFGIYGIFGQRNGGSGFKP